MANLQNILLLLIVYFLQLTICKSPDGVQCHEGYKCIPLSQCKFTDTDGGFIYPCHSGLNLICCPPGSYNASTHLENRKTSLFPVNCGLVITSDKISGGTLADLGQFPWMALLGYRQREIEYTQFLCGGSIITENYVLTAAHCLQLERRLELVVVRLGEHNLTSEIDCIQIMEERACADRYVDNPVEQLIAHPQFNSTNLKNDIALIKVRRKIFFTDYIKPVCLPFERGLETKSLSRQKFVVSGWGKTSSSNLGGSTTLQYTSVKVWNQKTCNQKLPPEVRPLRSSQLCANGNQTEDACKGDSGGPLVNATLDIDGELRYFQIGIVSFAATMTCGNPQLPTVYTRIDKYLPWIVDNIS